MRSLSVQASLSFHQAISWRSDRAYEGLGGLTLDPNWWRIVASLHDPAQKNRNVGDVDVFEDGLILFSIVSWRFSWTARSKL